MAIPSATVAITSATHKLNVVLYHLTTVAITSVSLKNFSPVDEKISDYIWKNRMRNLHSHQYGCSSFCTSGLIDGQLCNTYSDSMLRCLSPIVTSLISSAVMQSGMFMHNPIAFMVMFIPSISSSLFVL